MVAFGFLRRVRLARAVAGILWICAIAVLAGCGGGGGPKVVKVTGKVYYQDKPYPKMSIWFHPESPADGLAAQAMADQDGSFAMLTPGAGDGVVPGRYKVGIRFPPKGFQPPRDLQKYASPKTTPLSIDVPAEGLTNYEVKLK